MVTKYIPMVTKTELNKQQDPSRIPRERTRPQKVLVSVIIPAYNEASYIEDTLRSLHRQRCQNMEILVVANSCTDKTTEIAKQLGAKVINLSKPSMNVARNVGAENSSGELLIFLDADTRASDNLLTEALKHYQNYSYFVSTCPVYADADNFFARTLMKVKNGLHRLGVRIGGSGIIICSKDAFLRARGFDPNRDIFEIRDFLKRACNGNRYYYLKEAYVITSMRRYTQKGYLACCCFWIKSWIFRIFKKAHRIHYPPVR